MSQLSGKRGTWINPYATPTKAKFIQRAQQVNYVIIKYGMAQYEQWAREAGVFWVAERMGESGVGSQNGPAHAIEYANELANQALQLGCIAAVINLEEADGGWHTDTGSGTRSLISQFRSRAPKTPLYASLDVRGGRPQYPYQRVCAELCDGVMPECYPGAFGLPAQQSFNSVLTPLFLNRWQGKDILVTYQTYGDCDVPSQINLLNNLLRDRVIQGANSYTLGHATDQQWSESLGLSVPATNLPPPPPPDLGQALIALHQKWKEQWTAIAERGTVDEAVSLADYWKKLVGH